MCRYFQKIFVVVCIIIPSFSQSKPFVMGDLMGQLGNQMFIIAATMSFAWEHDMDPFFPDLVDPPLEEYNISTNYEMVFYRLNPSKPKKSIRYTYQEPYFCYTPIPYHKNMRLKGYFQSEKYFIKNKDKIISLFEPSFNILNYLNGKYSDIIDHPKTVSIHVRSYLKEDPIGQYHPTLNMAYYEKAIELFDKDSMFVVFSNDIENCKKNFAHIKKVFRFIEREHYVHDFYLMSLCKDQIISNSSFSWWAAYLNKNNEKVVVAPSIWFGPSYSSNNTKDLLPNDWLTLEY